MSKIATAVLTAFFAAAMCRPAAAVILAQSLPPSAAASRAAALEQVRAEGKSFLAANAGEKGVVVLPSGVQYRVETEGTGPRPGPTDTVVVRYKGTLIDGTAFGSSGPGDTPEKFPVAKVIPGLVEALQLMKAGARWTVFIPSNLGFRERGPLEERVVIYDVTLLSVESGK